MFGVCFVTSLSTETPSVDLVAFLKRCGASRHGELHPMVLSQKKGGKMERRKTKMSPYPSSNVWKNRRSNVSQKGNLELCLFFLIKPKCLFYTVAQRQAYATIVAANKNLQNAQQLKKTSLLAVAKKQQATDPPPVPPLEFPTRCWRLATHGVE